MSVLERLNQRVDELLNNLSELNSEVERLRIENMAIKSALQEKDIQINKLYEELSNIDRAYEDIINKIDEAQK